MQFEKPNINIEFGSNDIENWSKHQITEGDENFEMSENDDVKSVIEEDIQ